RPQKAGAARGTIVRNTSKIARRSVPLIDLNGKNWSRRTRRGARFTMFAAVVVLAGATCWIGRDMRIRGVLPLPYFALFMGGLGLVLALLYYGLRVNFFRGTDLDPVDDPKERKSRKTKKENS